MNGTKNQNDINQRTIRWHIALVVTSSIAILGLLTLFFLIKFVPSEVKMTFERAGFSITVIGGAGLFFLLFQTFFQAFKYLINISLIVVAFTYFGLIGFSYKKYNEANLAQNEVKKLQLVLSQPTTDIQNKVDSIHNFLLQKNDNMETSLLKSKSIINAIIMGVLTLQNEQQYSHKIIQDIQEDIPPNPLSQKSIEYYKRYNRLIITELLNSLEEQQRIAKKISEIAEQANTADHFQTKQLEKND